MSSKKILTRHSVFYKIILSALICIGMLIGLCAAAAAFAYCTPDPMSLVKPLSIAIIILGASISALITTKLFGVSPALISALIVTLIMMSGGIIANRTDADLGALINCGCYMASAGLFSYLCTRRRKRVPHRRRK